MLHRLLIENYTVLSSAEVCFSRGLNVITGETGVGKSLLLDAVGYLLGERRSAFPVRSGCSKAVIEAEFDFSDRTLIGNWLEDHEFPGDFPVLIRREFADNGRSRLFINDTPANLMQSRALGDLILDLHGQHEITALFDRARQLAFLDDYAGHLQLVEQYRALFARIKERKNELQMLQDRIGDARNGCEVLRLQKRELQELSPQPQEMENLAAELKRLENAERIFELCSQICDRLNEAPGSAVENIVYALKKLNDLAQFYPDAADLIREVENSASVLKEVNRTLQEFNRALQHNPNYIESLRQRLMALVGFKKRWNYITENLDEISGNIDRQLASLTELEKSAQSLEEQIQADESALWDVGVRLSQSRQSAADRLEEQVMSRLKEINMPRAVFAVKFAELQAGQCYADGLDRIEFTLSPDGKIPHQPLRQVASGGEMSRILLALKGALAAADHVETLIFDEIDQGISGKIARKVGLQLKELSRNHQVILVTHLPQIASLGDVHHSVRAAAGGETAQVLTLSEDERIQELASLLTASGISEGALLNAREMLESARNFSAGGGN
jgi:DNA repair protein RecN (Recombination protein N)